MLTYALVLRKNNFIGLYNMKTKQQLFNTTSSLLANDLKRELGEGEHHISIIVEGDETVNLLGLPIL